MVKPSTVLIMQKAKEYIDLLRRTIQEMEIEVNDLRRALVAAGYPLPMPSHQRHQQMFCGYTSAQIDGATFGDSDNSSPTLLQDQMLSAPPLQPPQTSIPLDDHQSQLTFRALSDISLGHAQFDAQDIENMNCLQLVLNKSAPDLNNSSSSLTATSDASGRPISPVSPYQLDQVQGVVSSGKFKVQAHPLFTDTATAVISANNTNNGSTVDISIPGVSNTLGASMLGAHV